MACSIAENEDWVTALVQRTSKLFAPVEIPIKLHRFVKPSVVEEYISGH